MPAMMVAPVDTVMACGAMMADDARAMHGQHPAAASSSDKGVDGIVGRIVVVVGVVVWIVVVIDATDKHPVEVMPVTERSAGISGTGRNGGSSRADAANSSAAEAASGETTTSAKTAASAAATTTASATMPAANFDRQTVGNGFVHAGASGIKRRQRLGALAEEGRSHQ